MNIEPQKYNVSIEFSYESPVFDGDPTDLVELAELEASELTNILQGVLYPDEGSLKVSVVAVTR